MKRTILFVAFVAAVCATTDTSAQVRRRFSSTSGDHDKDNWYRPHRGVKPCCPLSTVISYDAASTILTVKFPSNSQGGTVEVFRNGTKVAGVTANSGTTFSCRLCEYGTGNYNVIVSNGNTVIDSKNFTVR